jgi:glutamate-ammonia-ligase adenylyltransferase
MPMTDLVRLESELARRHPAPWVRHHIGAFREAYFAAFDDEAVDRHLGQIIALTDEHPVAVEAWPEEAGDWGVEVVAYDAFLLLSTICTLLAIHGHSIVEGQAFTSDPHPPDATTRPVAKRWRRLGRPLILSHSREPDRRPRIVDRFRVQWAGDAAASPNWAEFRAELTGLVRLLREDKFEDVHRRLIPRFVAVMDQYRPEAAALETIDLTIDPAGEEFATLVRVGTRDSFGFLSLTTSALALCGIMIVQADIRTQSGRVDDTFWVTDRFGRRIEAGPRLRELRRSLILIEHYSNYLPHATNPEAALMHFSRFAADTMARPEWGDDCEALDKPDVLDALVRVLGESDFLWEDYLQGHPENFLSMVGDPDQWRRGRSPAELTADLENALTGAKTLEEKSRGLRWFRDREFFRAGVRAILGQSGGLDGFSAELSEIAEVLLQGADRITREELAPVLPRRTDGRPVPAALFALGKCGGRELGFGSDLELMLVYDDKEIALVPGSTAGASFDRFVTTLRRVLAARRGGTFDVDFRLRPYGKAGAPATALTAFAAYYRAGGPAWGYERQALIKLRFVAGDRELGREVEALRDQFVYGPEPFDLEGCRRLRKLQVGQLIHPGTVNAKYSPGALVDVEYFVQALQIIHGRSDTFVRTPSTVEAISALAASGRLSPANAELLHCAYRFLRTLIDALRMVHGDAKDLTVPRTDSDEFLRLTRRLHRRDPAQLQADLAGTLQKVRALWTENEGNLAETE